MRPGAGAAALAAILALAGCGGADPPSRETREYREWKGSQAVRRLGSNATGKLPGTVSVQLPNLRAKDPADFVELFVNGEFAHRAPVQPAPGSFTIPVGVGPGPAWLDLWDSTTNRHFRHSVDTRYGTIFAFEPTADGYEIKQLKKEE
jgi:hypothetical protein